MSVKMLSLLTPKVQAFMKNLRGFGGLDQADVAHALGHLHHPVAGLLLRAKYADDQQALLKLERRLIEEVERVSMEEHWRVHKPGLIPLMARLALIETITTMTCFACHGTKYRVKIDQDGHETGQVVACRYCDGTGRYRFTDKRCYTLLGIDRKSWERIWRDRYSAHILTIPDRWESIGLGGMRKRLR